MKNNRALLITLIVVVALFICAIIFVPSLIKPKEEGSEGEVPTFDVNTINKTSYIEGNELNGGIADHVKGDLKTAEVVVFEYADYQCSACALFAPWLEELVDEYDGKFAVIFRAYPLTNIHPNAIAAASAVEAAGLQGYWQEYGNLLFANQSEWFHATGDKRTNYFVTYFNSLTGGKGDPIQFKKDMASLEVKSKINFDTKLAESYNLTATPSFIDSTGNEIDFTTSDVEQNKTGIMNFFRNYINKKLGK